MRKIDLKGYDVGGGNTFNVKESLVAVLFNEEKLDPREVIRRDELARKIEVAGSDILLENSDWKKVVSGLNATDMKPLGRSVVEFVKRVLDAPEIDVQEAK